MIKSQTEQTIERAATDIWAYAADIVRHPEWMSVTDAAILRGVGSEVGSRGRERLASDRSSGMSNSRSPRLSRDDGSCGAR